MVPENARCTVDMLSQILYDKTEDVGKTFFLLVTLAFEWRIINFTLIFAGPFGIKLLCRNWPKQFLLYHRYLS